MGKKVLLFSNMLSGGGVEKVLQDITNYLSNKNYRITIVALDSRINTHIFSHQNIKVINCYRNKRALKKYSLAWFFFKLKQILCYMYILTNSYDAVLVLKEGFYMKNGVRIKASKKVAWVHSDYKQLHFSKSAFNSNAEELECMKKYDYVICVSNVVLDSICEVIGNPGNLVVRYNPIDVELIKKKAMESCPKRRCETKPIFVLVCRLNKIKRVCQFVYECCELYKKHKFVLWIVGDGEDKVALENIKEENNFSDLYLWGWRDNPYPYIYFADWLISTSMSESYGLTVHEAIALNTPVLATSLPVFKECIPKNKAILVDNGLNGLINEMEYILEHPELNTSIRNETVSYSQEELYDNRLMAIEELIL